jgi:hypothetical protein
MFVCRQCSLVGECRCLIVFDVAVAQCWNQSLGLVRQTRATGLLSLIATVAAKVAALGTAHEVSAAKATAVLGHLAVSSHVGASELTGRLLEATRARA